MPEIPQEELKDLPIPVLLALVRLDDFDEFPSDYAGSLSRIDLKQIHGIAQKKDDQVVAGEAFPATSTGPVALLPKAE